MLSFYTIWCRFQSSVFSVNRFRMLLWFLHFCFLCVKQCLIRGLFALWLFNSKNKLCQYSVVSDKFFVLPLVLWSNCLQIATTDIWVLRTWVLSWRSQAVPDKMLIIQQFNPTVQSVFCFQFFYYLDAVLQAIVPANSCLTAGANAMINLPIPLWPPKSYAMLNHEQQHSKVNRISSKCKTMYYFPSLFYCIAN